MRNSDYLKKMTVEEFKESTEKFGIGDSFYVDGKSFCDCNSDAKLLGYCDNLKEIVWDCIPDDIKKEILENEIEEAREEALEEVRKLDHEQAPTSETILLFHAVENIEEETTFEGIEKQLEWWKEVYSIVEKDDSEEIYNAILDGNLELARRILEEN